MYACFPFKRLQYFRRRAFLVPSMFDSEVLLTIRWFYGFLSRSECELLLRDQPVGTFLIRFSSSQPGLLPSLTSSNYC
jgi:hypothetical protein